MLSILGGCVTRDVFRVTRTDELVNNLWARMTVASAMARPIPSLMYEDGFCPVNFESRQSYIDVNKLLLGQIRALKPKILLLDFMSEIYPLGQADGGMVTMGDDTFKRMAELGLDLELIPPYSGERISLLSRTLPSFITQLTEEYGTAVYVHEIYQSEGISDENGRVTRFPDADLATIRTANRHLSAVYDLIRSERPHVPFFRGDPSLAIADKKHIWGASPFHFLSEYSESAYRQLGEMIGLHAPEKTS
jgi:hypothetical protein